LRGVSVILTSNGRTNRATTDALGAYSLSGLLPGEYEIDAELPGYRLDWAPDDIRLETRGCVQADLLMKADRRVKELLAGKEIVREITVPGRLVNFVVRE